MNVHSLLAARLPMWGRLDVGGDLLVGHVSTAVVTTIDATTGN